MMRQQGLLWAVGGVFLTSTLMLSTPPATAAEATASEAASAADGLKVQVEEAAEATPQWLGATEAVSRWTGAAGEGVGDAKSAEVETDAAEAETAEAKADPVRAAMERYAAERHAMKPAAAAAGWLELFERWVAEAAKRPTHRSGRGFRVSDFGSWAGPEASGGPLTWEQLVGELPGPAAWPELSEAVDTRIINLTDSPHAKTADAAAAEHAAAEHALSLLAAYLDGDEARFTVATEAAVDWAKSIHPSLGEQLVEQAAALRDLLAAEPGAEAVLKQLRREILEARRGDGWSIEVPDLVSLYGEAQARQLLEQVVTAPVHYLRFDEGKATKALARKVALEQIDQMPRPHFGLIEHVDATSIALFEAMQRKFITQREAAPQPPAAERRVRRGQDEGGLMSLLLQVVVGDEPAVAMAEPEDFSDSWEYRQAQVYYLMGLIVADRTDEAEALVVEHFAPDGEASASQSGRRGYGHQAGLTLPYGVLESLAEAGAAGQVYAFAERRVDQPGGAVLWPVLIRVGAQLDLSDDVLAKLEASMADMPEHQRAELAEHLADALLSADRVEEGAAVLQQQIATLAQRGVTDADTLQKRLELSLQLAQLGGLTRHPGWQEQGLADARYSFRAYQDLDDDTSPWRLERFRQQLVNELVRAGRPAEAERVLIESITTQAAPKAAAAHGYHRIARRSDLLSPMVELAELYAGAGRWADVLTLLKGSPYWGVDDVAEVLTATGADLDHGDPLPLGYFAAAALADAGRVDEAAAITRELLYRVGDQDAAYRLWLDLRGDDAAALLDELFERDPYEERPLIWKATWLLERGRIDDAHQTIRHAITVDPSDGEQGRGDRIRAYAVLGEVMEARGDAEGAATMAGVVRAIRQAEDADRFYAAGLLSRSVRMYEEALTYFNDAYCIQSRLAVRLADLGRFDEAIAHYEKAYELMPDSFGRVESHCFGCEGVFSDERVQPVAERVFTRLLETSPEKPQLHYLMGYLLSTQDRDVDAAAYYRRAVELDPQYLNAWLKLQGLSRSMHLPRDARDRIALQVFRLDPLGRHSSGELDEVRDVAAAWDAAASVQHLRHEPATELLPLPAAANKLAADAAAPTDPYASHFFSDDDEGSAKIPTPGQMLADHQITELTAQVLEFAAYR